MDEDALEHTRGVVSLIEIIKFPIQLEDGEVQLCYLIERDEVNGSYSYKTFTVKQMSMSFHKSDCIILYFTDITINKNLKQEK